MGNLVTLPFIKKEGKYFAPIASEEPSFVVVSGAVVANGNQIVSGIKGAYSTIKLKLPIANASVKKELFALTAQTVYSSQ